MFIAVRRNILILMFFRHVRKNVYHSTRVLSVFRGNFTIPRNSNNENKEVLQFPPDGVEGQRTITHFISLDISNTGTNGAIPYLLRGGIGFVRVSIGYNYRPAYGMNHYVEIYGR
jgi:hypothetical protein